MIIGLLMLRDENDILETILAINTQWVDCFYVLDGSVDHKRASDICRDTGKCHGYLRDDELPTASRDGAREYIYALARGHHGADHWFLLLHGDEVWMFDPRDAITARPDADGFVFRLPFAFPRDWDYTKQPLEQLSEFMLPGWPEFRMFHGGPNIHYDPNQHFNVQPVGLRNVVQLDWPILHYPYRSPESQRLKASRSLEWSPENYQAVRDMDSVFWDDARIREFTANTPNYDRVAAGGI